MKELLNYIYSLIDFSQANWDILCSALTRMEFKKDEYLLQTSQVCDSLFFISQGYCRAFYDKDGQEINTAFFFENDIATNLNSYSQDEKSAYAIQACEDVIVVRFDKKKLLEACKRDPQVALLGRKCLQVMAAKQEKHSDMYKLMTAQERYEYVEEHYPEMMKRISLTQLSSYLGVARETISRIRGRRL